jgi:hypothetical protein
MGGHKIYGLCIRKPSWDHQIAFVLAIFVIDQHEHTTCARLGNNVFDRANCVT